MTDFLPAQPMTRRERRELEKRGLLPDAAASVPAEQPAPEAQESDASPPDSHEPEPTVPAATPAQPMTRRERRMLEETGVIPIPQEFQQPAESSVLEETSLVEVTESTPPEPAPAPAEPLPPVFGPPVTSTAPEQPSPVVENPEPTSGGDTPPPDSTSPSRVVGDVSMATSSLILPTTPTIDMSGPIGDTGEVIVTGQITLPHRLAETGSIPAMVEDKDDDEYFDAFVTGEIAAMSQPIRASKAVSGQGDDTDILLVRRVRWGTAAILTATGAAVLGLGAVVLLVIALLTDTLV